MIIPIALALLDFAPVFFLSLGLFFLARLVDRLDSRCRSMALSGFVLVMLGALAGACSNLALAVSGEAIPLLQTSLYVFCGPGFTLMAGALFRGWATVQGHSPARDPWIAPTGISWLFLLAALYLEASLGGDAWKTALVGFALAGCAATCLLAAVLGLKRQLHMAAALFILNLGAMIVVAGMRSLISQSVWIQLLDELLSLAAQSGFAFAAWRVAAEYRARVGPTAET